MGSTVGKSDVWRLLTEKEISERLIGGLNPSCCVKSKALNVPLCLSVIR